MSGFVPLLHTLSRCPLPLLRGLGRILALILRYMPLRTLAYSRLNFHIAQPFLNLESNHAMYSRHILQQAQRNELLSYCEFIHIWGSSNERNIARIHQVIGEEYFFKALKAKQGVILVIPHLGTWEIMNAWLSQYTSMTVMYKPLKQNAADQFVRQARSRTQATLVPTDESGVKALFRTLKQGGVTAILPDHSPEHGQHKAIWFGVPLYSSQLIAKLMQRTAATPLLLYAIRNDQGGYTMTIKPLSNVLLTKTNSTLDASVITQRLHDCLQDLIQQYPQHYHWSYKRFKASPETNSLYTMAESDALTLIRTIQATSIQSD